MCVHLLSLFEISFALLPSPFFISCVALIELAGSALGPQSPVIEASTLCELEGPRIFNPFWSGPHLQNSVLTLAHLGARLLSVTSP